MKQKKKLLRQAKILHSELNQSSKEIEKQLMFLQNLCDRSSNFLFCGNCSANQLGINKSYERAFSTFSEIEQVKHYLECLKIVKILTNSGNSEAIEDQVDDAWIKNKVISMYCFNQKQKEWEQRTAQINQEKFKIRFRSNGKELELKKYLIRDSKKKGRISWVLEAIEDNQSPETFRISNDKQSSEQFFDIFRKLIYKSLRERYLDSLHEKVQIKSKLQRKLSLKFTNFSIEQCIANLHSFEGFQQIKKGTFYCSKLKKIKKCHEKYDSISSINMQSIYAKFLNSSIKFHWKKQIQEMQITQEKDLNIQTITEVHKFSNGLAYKYIYTREKNIKNQLAYFYDTSLSKLGQKPQEGIIQYCLWKIEKTKDKIQIIVEAVIKHNYQSQYFLMDQFLGQIKQIIEPDRKNLQGQVQYETIVIEQKRFISSSKKQIEELSNGDSNQLKEIILQNQEEITIRKTKLKTKKSMAEKDKLSLITYSAAITQKQATNRLKFRHNSDPYEKEMPKLKIPKEKDGHPYFEGEWRFNQQNQMIFINERVLDSQSDILGSILKKVAITLFTGRSIMNLSLPVKIFGSESYLSLNCRSLAYAPIFLQQAARQKNPITRMGLIIKFAIGFSIAFIKMEKPFNPIIGQTYQAFINGCPIYAQQISHHPAIASIFMKGRGYMIYGNLESKISMTPGSGVHTNEGFLTIVFDQFGVKGDVIKLTLPGGQISGLLIGDRTLLSVGGSQIIDQTNSLFINLIFGRHKGKTQYSKLKDGIEGQIVQLPLNIDRKNFKEIKIEKGFKSLGTVSGRWNHQVYLEDQLLFDSWTQYPCIIQQHPCPLESDSFYREDLQLRMRNQLQKAQIAKENAQQLQRNDRKLRQKFIEQNDSD